VGDTEFQKKCLGKMEDVSTKEGRTVLFVSHNMGAIQSLCKRAILLNSGSVVANGPVKSVVANYLQNGMAVCIAKTWNDLDTAPGNENGCFLYAGVSPVDINNSLLTLTSTIKITFRFRNFRSDKQWYFNLLLYNNKDVCIFNTASQPEFNPVGDYQAICYIPPNLLNNDRYIVRVLVHYMGSNGIDVENVLSFEIHDVAREGWMGEWIGVIRPELKWEVNHIG